MTAALRILGIDGDCRNDKHNTKMEILIEVAHHQGGKKMGASGEAAAPPGQPRRFEIRAPRSS